MFGFLSPAINGVAPGMGNNRASAAHGTFTISNSVIRSDDLAITTTGMRVLYRGTVDLEGRVNARAEGKPLHDVPIIGPVFSAIFTPITKLFEYKVTGTLGSPKTEPLYFIPRVVLFPFHPGRPSKDEDTPARTNSPSVKTP